MDIPKIGVDTIRKEAWDKVTGRAKYNADTIPPETLHVKMLTSIYAHAAGKGKAGTSWTVGAQAVEIEYDPTMHTYRLLKATIVMDVGKVLNPKTARGLIMGGMSMGIGLATREEFIYDKDGILENKSLRSYKLGTKSQLLKG